VTVDIGSKIDQAFKKITDEFAVMKRATRAGGGAGIGRRGKRPTSNVQRPTGGNGRDGMSEATTIESLKKMAEMHPRFRERGFAGGDRGGGFGGIGPELLRSHRGGDGAGEE
jgi:hypothetical protein